MNVGFYHIDAKTVASEQGYICARALVKSVRQRMPGVRVVQFTDQTSAGVKGVDEVRRKPSEPMALLRMRHHAGVDGEWLFVDTDVIVQRNVAHVFRKPFDIAVTTRNWPHVKAAAGFSERMPFNTGVMFSRCPHFWGEVYTRLRLLDAEQQHWMGDQEVICAMVADETRPYRVKRFNGAVYNFPPMIEEDAIDADALEAQACLVHYKGPRRKPLLLARLKQESRRCA